MLTGAVVKWNKEQPRKIITCNLQVKYRRYYMNICIFGASPEALARIKKDLSNDNVFEPKHMCGKHIDVIVVRDDKSIEVEYIDDALKRYKSNDWEYYAQIADLYKIAYRQITKYIPKLLTYDEFLEQNRVHKTYKCYVRGCNNVGEYDCHTLDGGIYSVCEKHGEMWDKYCMYIQYLLYIHTILL